MPIEYLGKPYVVIMSRGDVFSQEIAQAFRRIKWNVRQVAPSSFFYPCDVMIIKSARNPEIIEQYKSKGVPVFVYDWGYFNRVNAPDQHRQGYWQLSHEKLNNMPDWNLPPDRFNESGASISKANHDKNGYVLVCGQMPIDAAVAGTDHKQWLIDQCAKYTNQGYDVRYREHPRGGVKLNYPKAADDLQESMRGARFIVTYNSNVGHDALIAGVPVVCDSVAPYAELSGEALPSIARRLKYFSRAAYGQWMYSETDKAVQFLLNEWMPRLCLPTKP